MSADDMRFALIVNEHGMSANQPRYRGSGTFVPRVAENDISDVKKRVKDDEDVSSPRHLLTIGPIGSRDATTFRNDDGKILVKCGCFEDDIKKFLKEVNRIHGDSRHGQAYRAAVELAKIQIYLEG